MKTNEQFKNLFDFATKELSQDGFLRWFFENYKNSQIGPIVVDFINYFSKGQHEKRQAFNLKFNDITQLISHAQVNNIDVSIDFWCEKLFKGHRTIVIEDKTASHEHSNQLEHYNNCISKWKYDNNLTPTKCVYKIFYKTHEIDSEELRRVASAKWTAFGIEEIYSFFIKYKNKTDSDVLNNYIDYINRIHTCYQEVSKEICSKWNPINWETFFNKRIKPKYSNIDYKFECFRGIYNSMILTMDLNNTNYLKCAALEIQIKDKLIPCLHPLFNVGNKWDWSINVFKDDDRFDECNKELTDLREFVEKQNSFLKRGNTARAFASIDEMIELNCKTDKLEKLIDRWASEMIRLITLYNNKERK